MNVKITDKMIRELSLTPKWRKEMEKLVKSNVPGSPSMSALIKRQIDELRTDEFGDVSEVVVSDYERKLVVVGFEIARQYIQYCYEESRSTNERLGRRKK